MPRLLALVLLACAAAPRAQTITVRLDPVRTDGNPLFGPGTGAAVRGVGLDDGDWAGLPVALDSAQHARIGLPRADTLTVVVGVDAEGRRRAFAGTAALAPLALDDEPMGVVVVTDSSGAEVRLSVQPDAGFLFYQRLDARVGTADFDGTPRALALGLGAAATEYEVGPMTNLMIDLDGDGAFAARRRDAPGEVLSADTPFRVGERTFRLAAVAPDGSHATFEALDPDAEALAVGFVMPDLALVRLDGTALRLSELRGRVVVLNWWADFCAPCYAEMPGLSALADAYAGDDRVAFVAVADNTPGELAAALDGRTFTYQQTAVADSAAAEALLGDGFPRHVVVGADGRVVFDMLGGSPTVHDLLAPVVAPLVAAEDPR